MIYTKYDDQDELMQMREQLQLLKDKLTREHIVNEKIMRRAVRDKLSSVQRRSRMMTYLGAAAVPFVVLSLDRMGLSMVYIVMTAVFMVAALVVEFYTMRLLHGYEMMSGSLIASGLKVARVKRLQQQWLVVGIIFVMAWLPLGAYELRALIPNDADYHTVLISGGIGGVIGGIIGSIVYSRNQRELSEIIEQIKELTEEENI